MSRDTKISFRQVQIFLAAVEHRSFAKTAASMGLAASAVSMQMTNLAQELGVVLFEKEGRSVRPTPVATAMLPYAEKLLDTMEGMVASVSSIKDEMQDQARLSMVTTARNFGPHLVQAFQEAHPDISIEVSIYNRRGVIAALQNRKVDVALMGRTPRKVEVEATRFAKHPYVLIAAPSHPLAKASRIRRADLVGHKFFVREEGSGTRMVHDHFFTKHDLPLPKAQVMEGNANIKNAVMAGLGIAFMSAHTISLELAADKLCVLKTDGMPELRDWYVVNLKGATLPPAAQRFKDFATTQGGDFLADFFDETMAAE